MLTISKASKESKASKGAEGGEGGEAVIAPRTQFSAPRRASVPGAATSVGARHDPKNCTESAVVSSKDCRAVPGTIGGSAPSTKLFTDTKTRKDVREQIVGRASAGDLLQGSGGILQIGEDKFF
jgi:hypothetical protein